MVVKVGINGFGRIGRLAFRRIQNVEGVEVTRINDLTDPVMLAHLLKYDTTQGRFDGTVEVKEGGFEVNGKFIKVSAERDPEQIDWATDGVEIVLEATGSLLRKKQLKNTLKVELKKLLSLLLVETTLKQLYSTLTTTFLTVLKQLSQVLHVLQTAWLQWLKLFKTTLVLLKD
ncbi:glyceraldehyde-3-phosphate dehydrogenase [Streptococcus pneumoniae]|nr:glyceraldehyde-3-phosphate dehydrogenase [Streptococcus pneumoniae]